MAYYILPYLFLIISLLLFRGSEYAPSFRILFFSVLPASLIVLLRGNVGTDTDTYLRFFKELITNTFYDPSFEQGFVLLARLLVNVGLNETSCVAIIGLLTIVCLCICFSDNFNKMFVFTALLFPIFFYDMTMNGLRYGLAFSLSSIAVAQLYKNRFSVFLLLAILALTIQVSSLLICMIFFLEQLSLKSLVRVVLLIATLIYLSNTLSLINIEYLYSRQDAYKDLVSPESSSGISPLVIFALIYAIYIYFNDRHFKQIPKTIHLILLFQLISFAISQLTYAGLRLQMLFLYALILYVAQNIYMLKFSMKTYASVCVVGIIGFLITLKHFSYVDDEVLSPFLPYKFFWDQINN